MKPENLLFSLNDIGYDLILDADTTARKQGISTRRLITFALAAALVLSLAACGVAATYYHKNLIFYFFKENSTEGLSQSQVDYLKENTQDLSLSQTIGGYTATIDTAITDGHDIYISLTITAPEDAPFDGDRYSFPDGAELSCEGGGLYQIGYSTTHTADPTGKTIQIALSASDVYLGRTDTGTFANDKPWTLTLNGLAVYYNDGGNGYWIRPTLVEDSWTFQLQLKAVTETLELISDPVVTTADNSHALNDDPFGDLSTLPPHYTEIELTSIQLRPLGLSLNFRYLEDYDPEIACELGDIILVNKDGSQIPLTESGGGWNGFISYRATAPILFAEADYLLFRDGTKVPIPQQ